jgi:deoxycytidine triphosphate deaminase
MILSDRSIREELATGRIAIEPLDPGSIQPSSVDLHLDRYFRVFLNHTMRVIDVKEDQEDLTELVEIGDDDSFVLHPGEFVLGSTAERVSLPDDLVARLEGKALSLSTEIPTPDGWTTMAELSPGDTVFDEKGQPCRVVAVTPELTGRPCREVVFSDGQVVVADALHQWVTTDKNGRRYGRRTKRVVTTDEVAARLRVRGECNHQVALAGAIECDERSLPIDPYVLGAWIGDGTSSCADITSADEEILDQIRAAGYEVHKVGKRLQYRMGGVGGDHRDRVTGRYAADGSLNSILRAEGLLGHKHIPAAYLRASVAQRSALLAGLMDTDGYADKWGRCEFTTIREPLARQVAELVASLGFRPVIAKKTAWLNGVDCGPKYDVTFTPHRPVFRLSRKVARQKVTGRFHLFRAIRDVREIPSVPVRCIEVDAPSGQFLVTRSFIPTHNSSLGRLGLLIHSTAGFVDAGWDGHLTLELSNVANLPIILYPGMKIGQISFLRMTTPADAPYGSASVGSKYQGQRGPTPSRYFENFRPRQ